MTTEDDTKMNEDYPVNDRFRLLYENDQIQNFLHRHGLTAYGGIPLRQRDLEKRLQQIDDQSSVDLIAQSLVEKALDIKRPLRKIQERSSLQDSKQSVDHNPYLAIYDNSCAITMIYYGLKTIRNDTLYTFKIQSDEVLVMQYQTNSNSIIVYKSFVKPNNQFTFKSHRLPDTPFTIAIYINGVIDSRISTCCEHGYFKQHYSLPKRSAFQLFSIDGGTPCYTCQANELTDSSTSDKDEAQSDWISTINLNQVTPSTSLPTSISVVSEPIEKIKSKKKNKNKSKSKGVPSNFMPTDADISSEPLQSKPNEIQTSTKAEKLVSNEETAKDLKNEGKVVNTVDQKINQTDEPTPKQNQKGSIQEKIANEEEKGEQGSISSIANHEMLQLLSKYLALLLPSPKSQTTEHHTAPSPTTTIHQQSSKTTYPVDRSQKQIESTAKSFPTPQWENVETFVLIWLDATIDMNEDTIISQTKLRAIVNTLFTFHTIDKAIDFIQNVQQEKVFLIISGALAWPFIDRPEKNDLSQLDSIYIFCRDESKHKPLMEREHKVRGIFTTIDPLCMRLKEDLKQTSNDLLPISVAPGTINQDKSITDKQKQDKQLTFLRAQLHRELLFTMEYPDDARFDLVEFCKNIYTDNETEQESIEELKNDYHTGKAVWWYTRPTFLYKMLNTALFRQDIPMLYKFHFFIKDLHMQLEQLHSLYKSSLESRTFTVYRGLGMPRKVFDETIQQEVGNLLAFDTFLSTSLKKEVALDFARNKSNNDDESILLEIEINTDKLERPFADVSHLSAFNREDEILFSIGTVFRIDHIADEKDTDGIWVVHLSSIEENDEQLKTEIKQTQSTLLNFFKRVCQAQLKCGDQRQIATSYINIASIYYKKENYKESLKLYQNALENLLKLPSPDPLTIATYRNYIAMVYMALDQPDEALSLYEEVLKIRLERCETNDPLLIDTLHTIGDIYRGKKKFNEALEQYRKALEMQPISPEPPFEHNPSSIAATYINIALVYHQQNKTDQALHHFLKALEYQRQYLSAYHPILAFLYNNIGAMYYRLKDFQLALQNQLVTLQIEERSLPKDHKTFAVTYINIANSYEQLKDYDQAIDYAQKALNQLRLHLSEDHPDIQSKLAYLESLSMDKAIFQAK